MLRPSLSQTRLIVIMPAIYTYLAVRRFPVSMLGLAAPASTSQNVVSGSRDERFGAPRLLSSSRPSTWSCCRGGMTKGSSGHGIDDLPMQAMSAWVVKPADQTRGDAMKKRVTSVLIAFATVLLCSVSMFGQAAQPSPQSGPGAEAQPTR